MVLQQLSASNNAHDPLNEQPHACQKLRAEFCKLTAIAVQKSIYNIEQADEESGCLTGQ